MTQHALAACEECVALRHQQRASLEHDVADVSLRFCPLSVSYKASFRNDAPRPRNASHRNRQGCSSLVPLPQRLRSAVLPAMRPAHRSAHPHALCIRTTVLCCTTCLRRPVCGCRISPAYTCCTLLVSPAIDCPCGLLSEGNPLTK